MKLDSRTLQALALAATLACPLSTDALAQESLHIYHVDGPIAATHAAAISPSGTTVVGEVVGRWFGETLTGPFAYLYESPMSSASWLPRGGEPSSIHAISPDERFVGGAGSNGTGYSSDVTIWDLLTGESQQFGPGTITGMSRDARVAVGYSPAGAVAWENGIARTLTSSTFSRAQAVSHDGGTITGYTGSYFAPRAAVWTSAGETLLPLPTGTDRSAAYAMSADAGVIVGYSGENPNAGTADPRGWLTRWTRNANGEYVPQTIGDGLIPLTSDLLTRLSAAASPDGSVIGGTSTYYGTGVIWSESLGLTVLDRLLASQLTVSNITEDGSQYVDQGQLGTVTGIAADNRTVVGTSYWSTDFGWGFSPSGTFAYRATLPHPSPNCPWSGDSCFADYNNDTGIDGDDVIAYFQDWDSAAPCADINQDTGVDSDDVIQFFGAWDNGGLGLPGC